MATREGFIREESCAAAGLRSVNMINEGLLDAETRCRWMRVWKAVHGAVDQMLIETETLGFLQTKCFYFIFRTANFAHRSQVSVH